MCNVLQPYERTARRRAPIGKPTKNILGVIQEIQAHITVYVRYLNNYVL